MRNHREIRAGSAHLFGGANQDFANADVFGPGDSKDDDVGDILAARILDPLHDLFQVIRAPSKHRDARPLLRQSDRSCLAYTRRRPGH